MRLFEILNEDVDSPLDDMQFADDIASRATDPAGITTKDPAVKRRRGPNAEKAKRIRAAAEIKAKKANPEDGESPNQYGQNMSFLNFRLGK